MFISEKLFMYFKQPGTNRPEILSTVVQIVSLIVYQFITFVY